MKIFISHSSKDKWAARQISKDLIALGATTFLDEKDLRTGQSIDGSIKKHLKECDDFLILISPASLKSEWVLIELGGAIALEKTIIPILLYVGVNEMPQAINLRLSRDINDVDTYYSEIEKKVTGKPVERKKRIQRSGGFTVGDAVRITNEIPNDVMTGSFLCDWEEGMNQFLGKETQVREVLSDDTYLLKIDDDGSGISYLFAGGWLTKI